jgi:RNA polymerase sigma-70 factor (ECF subfamily)
MALPTTPSDDELVRSIQQGSLDAFALLYERHLPMVYRRVKSIIPLEDVEDVTQEIFIAVMKSLRGFRFEARFTTWLRTLVNRQVADYYRGRGPKDSSLDELADFENDRFLPFGNVEQIRELDEIIILRQALQKLPENYQEILMLRFAEGLQFDQIAQLNGQTLEATKSLFRRAIIAINKQVANV